MDSAKRMEDNPVQITFQEAAAYMDAILAAIAKDNRFFENDRGLAEYIHDEALSKKVHSLYPSVEVVDVYFIKGIQDVVFE